MLTAEHVLSTVEVITYIPQNRFIQFQTKNPNGSVQMKPWKELYQVMTFTLLSPKRKHWIGDKIHVRPIFVMKQHKYTYLAPITSLQLLVLK